jgi:hypothetical protein
VGSEVARGSYRVTGAECAVASRGREVASHRLEVASRRLGVASYRLGVASHRLGVASSRLGVASRGLGVASRRLGEVRGEGNAQEAGLGQLGRPLAGLGWELWALGLGQGYVFLARAYAAERVEDSGVANASWRGRQGRGRGRPWKVA